MSLPASLRASVEAALGESLVDVRPVSGGCIHHGSQVRTESGARYFLKWNIAADPDVFAAEEDGLRALRAAAAEGGLLAVPEPVGRGGGGEAPPWFLMEYFEPGAPGSAYARDLGTGLALLHGCGGGEAFGWHRHNWIGSLAQDNTPDTSWARFWTRRRIAPQLEQARRRGFLHGPVMDRYLEAAPAALEEVRDAALLHGDLWGGNVFPTTAGKPVLVDPAVYRGDALVDLAMSELFGGFNREFYRAYHQVRVIPPEYNEVLRDVYQTYYLLVHVNLFGAGYVAETEAAAARVVAAVR